MTGLDFLAAGLVVTAKRDGGFRIEGDANIMSEFRFEVLTRIGLVGDEESWPRRFDETFSCEACGDRIGHGVNPRDPCPLCPSKRCRYQAGGLCLICQVARAKALKDRKAER